MSLALIPPARRRHDTATGSPRATATKDRRQGFPRRRCCFDDPQSCETNSPPSGKGSRRSGRRRRIGLRNGKWYAIAKIAGLRLCQACRNHYGVDFISAMPTNLCEPGDSFAANSSHVPPALIRKAHEAKAAAASALTIWGTGAPRRRPASPGESSAI
jgi:hypothetical protein